MNSVRQRYNEPPAAAQPDIVVCAGAMDLAVPEMTSPSFCTTASERVYITASSGEDANGGSQGAVGDRRAAICGANAAGAGGL